MNIIKSFNEKKELYILYNALKKIENIFIEIIENNIIIKINNNNIITIYYYKCYHLYVKAGILDSELITSEMSIENDIKHLIELYKE